MGATAKAARDAVLAGGPATAITAILISDYNVPAMTASAVGLGAAWLLPRLYRALRARWPWLSEFDPGSSA